MTNSYIKHGYLADLYEPWVAYEGTEWGDQMRSLHDAYNMGEDYAGLTPEQMDQLEAILREKIQELYEYRSLLGAEMGYNEHYIREARNAVIHYKVCSEYWKDIAQSASESDTFEEVDKAVPAWMKDPSWIDKFVEEKVKG